MSRADTLPERMSALRDFVSAAGPHLPPGSLVEARALLDRSGTRLALSRTHTVVALAGATGSGKSTLFNRLAGVDLSPTGVRRPTTGSAYACVFGQEDADALLDWLGVGKRFTRSDPGLDGLVLLDLPDFDSVEAAHRVEVDRLLAVVDLIVWVLHPQKYADKVVHRQYIGQFHRHGEVTVVALNQVDLLSADDLAECLTDLRTLLAGEGLGGVPVVTTSAVGPPGTSALTTALEAAVRRREAVLARLGADLDGVLATLETVTPQSVPATVDTGRLVDALATSAGVPMVTKAVDDAYVHRARKVAGWPPLRWVRRLRPDPLGRLHVDGSAEATSISPASPAAQAGTALALRALTDSAAGLPAHWSAAVLTAARSRSADLPDALDQAVARTDLGLRRRPWWWGLFGLLQWITTSCVAAGLLWLGVRYVLFALALPEPPMPAVGRVPLPTALLVGGALAALLIALIARPVTRFAARRAARRAGSRLRASVAQVADSHVLSPVRAVLSDATAARDAARRAR
ncbi:GTPase [Hamadaea tsunoensis]|uniref:GTPase n=1 Tax=Hamadaea tsunoensis TaxID=53368 RepID=UPI000409E20E|nr:GTPase [Hamadaea tsunoensis]